MKNGLRGMIWYCILIFILSKAHSQSIINFGSSYKFLKGSSDLSIDNWQSDSYNDDDWQNGSSPFWYGDGANGTLLDDMRNNYTTLFLRGRFDFTPNENIESFNLSTDFDDGFVIWINGARVLERNAPSELSKASTATNLRESGSIETISFGPEELNLKQGGNIIAIQCLNQSLTSSDLFFDVQIIAERKPVNLSDSLAVSYSHDAGFFDQPFQMTMTPPEGYSFVYTLDGSNPTSSSTAIASNNATTITINPTSTANRGATAGYIVKTSVKDQENNYSFPVSKTYLFVNQVKNQSSLASPWPQETNINGQRIDLDVESEIANHEQYKDSLVIALKAIPSISITTDNKNLFDPATGIFVNAQGHGPEWERDCSLELLNPDGSEGFSVNAGLRIRGGYSRNGSNPKHAFRLFFRGEYGDSKLNYPLFGDEGVDEFDKIDFRTSQNYSWAYDGEENARNTFLRDVFSRDMQREMGNPYSRSRYYHLYLNGAYWGLFMTQERAEARFAESYFGGDKDDYDVVKVTTDVWPYRVEATDGNLDSWSSIYDLTLNGNWSDQQYFYLIGRDANGQKLENGRVWVDIDNLIDYMLVIFYTGNCDAPVSSFSRDMPNNFYAIFNRNNPNEGYQFMAHDSEHSLMYESVYACSGIHENRVALSMNIINGLYGFHPQWLHDKLKGSAAYRQRFADRTDLFFGKHGKLKEDDLLALFNKRAEEIDEAIIANSLRWGGSQTYPPRTKETWLSEVNKTREQFFPFRSEIVLNQLVRAGLYSEIGTPEVLINDTITSLSKIKIQEPQTIILKNDGGGVLYYTMDGTDPRSVDGTPSEFAISSSVAVELEIDQSTILKIRTEVVKDWSPIREFSIKDLREDLGNIKITELHYHPEDELVGNDTINGKEFEFIEFINNGTTSLDLSGVHLDSAIFYEFPEQTILQPNEIYVIASSISHFWKRYGLEPNGQFDGSLSNSGEQLIMVDSEGNELLNFYYSDDEPWPTNADGDGYSLIWADRNASPADFNYWASSYQLHGSPFEVELNDVENLDNAELEDLRINEIHYHPSDDEDGIVDADEYEFMELVNIGSEVINLSGLVIDSAISFTFPLDTYLEPGSFYVIAANREHFFNRYQLEASAEYDRKLSNGGERLVFHRLGEVILDMTYSDKAPWPEEADGEGYSLVWNGVNENPGEYQYWQKSEVFGGSPFAHDSLVTSLHEIQNPELVIFPNPANKYIQVIYEGRRAVGNYSIHDLSGKKFDVPIIRNEEDLQLDISSLEPGVYLITVIENHRQITSSFIVQ